MKERLFVALFCFWTLGCVGVISNPLVPIVIPDAEYNRTYKYDCNKSLEYVFVYQASNSSSMEKARIKVTSENATHESPLIIVVIQKQGILSWQIPYTIQSQSTDGMKSLTYDSTTRTLCSTDNSVGQEFDNSSEEFVKVSISTASRTNISFEIVMTFVTDFYITIGKEKNVSITPATPVYYGFKSPQNDKNISMVIQVQSEDSICMTFSVQNATCPVFDLERNIQFSGYWQTVSKKGALTISTELYPHGFFVVLVVKADDTDCIGYPKLEESRKKTVTISVSSTITWEDYVFAIAVATMTMFAFFVSYTCGIVCVKIRRRRIRLREELNAIMDDNPESVTSTQASNPSAVPATPASPYQPNSQEDDSSLDEDSIDLMNDAFSSKDIVRTKVVLSVCDLARKEPRVLRHKSRLYLYYLGTVATFYALPVVQLVATNQYVLKVTGNQDLCYYNFMCSHPWLFWSDFNHVFSNFGYVLLGALFIFITYSREKDDADSMTSCYGIPQHYGLFYAMGFALIMEGVLSGCYHVCPNHTNFQFDTSFMYIIAVLCMVKIYQTRHPDINARAPVTFGVLAIIILLGLIGVLHGSRAYWIVFTIIHLITCISLSAQIYYMGRFKFNGGVFRRVLMTARHDARAGIRYLLRPIYWKRLLLLVIGNSCNVGLAVYGNMHHEKDFATYLLAVLMTNLIMYTFFYIAMKLCHRERILIQPIIYILLSFAFWGAAMYFFIHKTISWAETPARSREFNKPCVLFKFFDNHDIWHFLSAFAMFFSFMVLLTLDDDLVEVHRSQIFVF